MTKYCFVPNCTRSSNRNQTKRFIALPTEAKRRKLWFLAARRDVQSISKTSVPYICEDHFDLEKDADNWIKLKYYPGCKVILKPEVVPHIFECQPDRSKGQPPKERPTSANRTRRKLLETLISPESTPVSTSTSVPNSVEIILRHPNQEVTEDSSLPLVPVPVINLGGEEFRANSQVLVSSPRRSTCVTHKTSPRKSTPSRHGLSPSKRTSSGSLGRSPPTKRSRQPFVITTTPTRPAEQRSPAVEVSTGSSSRNLIATPRTRRAAETLCKLQENRRDKGTQTVIVQVACKSALCKPSVRSKSSQTVQCGLMKKLSPEIKSVAISPVKFPTKFSKIDTAGSFDSSDEILSGCGSQASSSYSEPLNTSGSSFAEDQEESKISNLMGPNALQKLNIQQCLQDPMYFLGIPKSHLKLVHDLADSIQADIVGVLITLKKKFVSTQHLNNLVMNFVCQNRFAVKHFRILYRRFPCVSIN